MKRDYWLKRIEEAWQTKSVLWLSGIRRAGKTTLCQMLPNTEYFDCELPSTRRLMDDPESFLESNKGKRIVLDEIHRLFHPSELLKIAADYFPMTQLIATGSSTLGASRKFKDTLTGRKKELWLTPMIDEDLREFPDTEFGYPYRFLRGGLPLLFLSKSYPAQEFQEWIDSYWAKDIQELFRIQRKNSFQKCFELLLANSGGIFEATRYAAPCEVSRPTISAYLEALEATFVMHVVRPFSSYKVTEIVSAPKVYGFDTGFICHHKQMTTLRPEDMGMLWEHYVLNELHAFLQHRNICYWRDKRGHEIDFILSNHQGRLIAIECKWSVLQTPKVTNIDVFLRHYPQAEMYVVSANTLRPFQEKIGSHPVQFVNLPTLLSLLYSSDAVLTPRS